MKAKTPLTDEQKAKNLNRANQLLVVTRVLFGLLMFSLIIETYFSGKANPTVTDDKFWIYLSFFSFVKLFLLLMFSVSIFNRNVRAYSWLCYVILLYIVYGIFKVAGFMGNVGSWFVSIDAILLFLAAMYFVHYEKRH